MVRAWSCCMQPASPSRSPPRPDASFPRPHDQTHGPVEEEVIPRPVREHYQPAPKADYVDEVHGQPDEPTHEAGKMPAAYLRDRGVAPDRRHDARVLVTKSFRSAVTDHLRDA